MRPPTAAALGATVLLALAACAGSDEGSGGPPSSSQRGTPSSADATVTATVTEIARDLEVPWGIAFLSGGDALVTLRDSGEIVRVSDGRVTRLGTVPGVAADGEGGLLGIALPPDGKDEAVYVYATTAQDNRVLRLPLRGSTLGAAEPVLTGIPKAGNHNGGRIAIGPDGRLYVATGDANDTSASQAPDSLGGKILRITTDGRPAPGNPDPDSPVWSSGHRNVQGLAWGEDKTMWASEFGQSTWDELNRITPGSNYGWPQVEGEGGRSGLVDPVATWSTEDASPSGIAVAEDGSVVLATLRGESLWRVPVVGSGADSRAGTPERLLEGEHGRLRDVVRAPDGSLWVLTSNTFRGDPRDGDDRVLRVTLR